MIDPETRAMFLELHTECENCGHTQFLEVYEIHFPGMPESDYYVLDVKCYLRTINQIKTFLILTGRL